MRPAMIDRSILLSSVLTLCIAGQARQPGDALLHRQTGGADPTLGPLPRDCPPGPRSKMLNPAFAVGYGAYPVWGVGFSEPHATLVFGTNRAQLKLEYHAPYGWGHKLLWVMPPGYKGRVMLHGGEVRGGFPLWFDGRSGMTRTLVLDPQWVVVPTSSTGVWATFPSGLYVPKAGCYYLDARWRSGQWRMTFGAGTH